MDALGENRHIQYFNLSWNNLIERGEITDPQRCVQEGPEQLNMSEADITKIMTKSI
jgi:hypothetical protein